MKCKSRPKLVFATGIFVIFVNWHRISWHFWDEDLLFFGDQLYSAGKTFEFLISARKFLRISVKTFFFWRSPVFGRKNVWISDFHRKIPLNIWSSSCSFDSKWDKFLVPPCPSRIHINKLLLPPQNLFLPSQSRYPGAGPVVPVQTNLHW